MRSMSIFFGWLALVSIFQLLKKLTGDTGAALLASALVAVDFAFIRSAATGRMDMMSAGLALAASAAFVTLREKNLALALLASHSISAANSVTHPNAIFGFLMLALLTWRLDRGRLSWRLAALAAVPYFAAMSAWGLYILQDPHDFVTQFFGNAGGRLWGLVSPAQAIAAESARYLGQGSGATVLLRSMLFLGYLSGAVYVLASKELRRSTAAAVLLTVVLATMCYFAFLEGTKLHNYAVHVTPLLAALSAISARHIAARFGWGRWIAVAIALFAAGQAGGTAMVIARDSYHQVFLPVADYLEDSWDRKAMLWGSAELGFRFGFVDALVDDSAFGYYSGKRAEWLILNKRYRHDHSNWKLNQPPLYDHVTRLLHEEYRQVHDLGGTIVYRRTNQ
jgi:4-amino-4-deoxy-L-arabinose transferase-like glycosyltransferase